MTHDQMIFSILALCPALSIKDHGTRFMVGMPVEGVKQTGPAFIMAWNADDVPQPTQEQIGAKWKEIRDSFSLEALYNGEVP